MGKWITKPSGKKVFLATNNPHTESERYIIKQENDAKNERKQFINDFNKMADDKKLKLLKDVSMNKDERDDFMKSGKTANDLAENYNDGREVLADISTKLGYDYSV
jgi:Trp operon repressor